MDIFTEEDEELAKLGIILLRLFSNVTKILSQS